MNRRNFFKTVTGFVAALVFVPKTKAEEWTYVTASYNGKGNSDGLEICGDRNGTLCPRCKFSGEILPKDYNWNCQRQGHKDFWQFYINGEKVNSNRAVDELGALRFPFQGAKKGDVCAMKSKALRFAFDN